jgi:hypothetical protein
MSMVAISAGVGGATGIASTVAQVTDAKKRREFEQKFAFLDARQRAALERELQSTNNSNEKLKILSNAAANIRSAQSSAILSSQITSKALAKSSSDRTLAIAVIGGAAIILGAIVLIKK